MQPYITKGAATPEEKQQRELHKTLSEFTNFLKHPKDAQEVQRDTLQPVPVAQLPMVF